MNNEVRQVANKFNVDKAISVSRFGEGLINDTYLVAGKRSKYILQKLHPIFRPTVLIDTHNITTYLLDNKLATPLLIKTKSNKLFFKNGKNNYWRMLTYIPGRCYEAGVNTKQAFSAGQLMGRFHNILSGFDYRFKHEIKNFHDPEARINKLRLISKKFRDTWKYNELVGLTNTVLKNYERVGNKIKNCPDRIIHGDLKINNVRFNFRNKAICLLDLDTLGKNKIATDIASGARTWCNKADEGDIKNSRFDLKVFENMLAGYLSTAKFITTREIKSIPETIERVILVLVARFITDAFEEKYFRFNSGQYKNLYEQNKTKALAQVVLYEDFVNKRKSINKIIKNLCRQ